MKHQFTIVVNKSNIYRENRWSRKSSQFFKTIESIEIKNKNRWTNYNKRPLKKFDINQYVIKTDKQNKKLFSNKFDINH